MSHSFDTLMDFTKKTFEERDLALWFFSQTNLTMAATRPSGGGALRWSVKLMLDEKKFKIIAHSYTSPFEAIKLAQQNLEQGTGRDI